MNARMTTLAVCVFLCIAMSVALAEKGPRIEQLDVFYDGKFSDNADTSKYFLADGSVSTNGNITNYVYGITGIRVFFDDEVDFANDPEDAFAFEWTTGTGKIFTPVSDPDEKISVTTSVQNDKTVVKIVIDEDHVERRWLKVIIDADEVSADGNALDGELDGNPVDLPSGNGTAGGDAVFYHGNVPGDVDGDRKTTLDDWVAVLAEIEESEVPITNVYDVDKSSEVQQADADATRAHVNPFITLPVISP